MKLVRGDCAFDVDLQRTVTYYEKKGLCDCVGCRNFYAQARQAFPALNAFLADFGVDAGRPDETGWAEDGGEIDYHFAAYTVSGTILKMGKHEIGLWDGARLLRIAFGSDYVPNEQTAEHFVITVYGIRLPDKTGERQRKNKKQPEPF